MYIYYVTLYTLLFYMCCCAFALLTHIMSQWHNLHVLWILWNCSYSYFFLFFFCILSRHMCRYICIFKKTAELLEDSLHLTSVWSLRILLVGTTVFRKKYTHIITECVLLMRTNDFCNDNQFNTMWHCLPVMPCVPWKTCVLCFC